MKDFMWKRFEETGNIKAYLRFKNINKRADDINKSNSINIDKLF